MERKIEAPEWTIGTLEEAASWLNVDKKLFRAWWKRGLIPPPDVAHSRQEYFWRWETVLGISYLLPWLLQGQEQERHSPSKVRKTDSKVSESNPKV